MGHAQVKLDQRIVRQPLGRRFQRHDRPLVFTAIIQDPAIGILECRHIGCAQPLGNGIGTVKAVLIGAMLADQRGQVVGQHHGRGIGLIELFIDGDGRVEIAGQFLARGLGHQKARTVRGVFDPVAHDLISLVTPVQTPQQRRKRGIAVFGSRMIGNHLAIGGFGGLDLALGGLHRPQKQVGAHVLRILGDDALQEFQRLFRLAGLHIGADQIFHGGGGLARLRPHIPQQPDRLIEILLPGGGGDPDAIGGALGLIGAQRLQLAGHGLGPGPILQRQPQARHGRHQFRRIGIFHQSVAQHRLGIVGLFLLGQEIGIAQDFRHPIARSLHRQGQTLQGQPGRAVALMGGGQNGHQRCVLRFLVQGGTQIGNGVFRPVLIQRVQGPQAQTLDVLRIFLQHLVKQGLGAGRASGAAQKIGQSHLGVVDLLGILQPRGQQVLYPFDCPMGIADAELEGRQCTLIEGLIGGPAGQALQFGQGHVIAMGLAQEAHHIHGRFAVIGAAGGRLAQHGLGAGLVAAGHIPADQRGRDRAVIREKPVHVAQLIANPALIADLLQNGQPGQMQAQFFGIFHQDGVHMADRGGEILGFHPITHQHHGRGNLRRIGLQHLTGHRQPLFGAARPVIDRGFQGLNLGIAPVQFHGLVHMGLGRVNLIGPNQHTPDIDPRLAVVRGNFRHPEEIPERALKIPLFQKQFGIFQPGQSSILVQLQRIAEFQNRLVDFPRSDQFQPLVVIGFGPVFGIVARGQCSCAGNKGGNAEHLCDGRHMCRPLHKFMCCKFWLSVAPVSGRDNSRACLEISSVTNTPPPV